MSGPDTPSRRPAQAFSSCPPYSPDFNPIENAFAKLKALLRAAAERTVDGLWDMIGNLLGCFTLQECANYFAAAGYDAP
jgi:transposase